MRISRSTKLHIDIITIFPNMFRPIIDESMIKRAQRKGLISINVHNLRNFSRDKHHKVDARPFGGGPGMVFTPEPLFRAVERIRGKRKARVIMLTPQGKTLTHRSAQRLAKNKHLILICGRYEGIDERVRLKLVDEEVSIGDYVLTGGELPAMVLIDAVARFIPGVVGDKESVESDTFADGLLKYPQYTRPANFRRMRVPSVLLSGDHRKIQAWRKKQSSIITGRKRPDLLDKQSS